MKSVGRIYFDPANLSQTKKSPVLKISRLKDLSKRHILCLIKSIEYEIREKRLFLTDSQVKMLRKRLEDLGRELTDRIEHHEYLASINESPSEIEAFRRQSENPPRKALGKSYVKGTRLRAGKKVGIALPRHILKKQG